MNDVNLQCYLLNLLEIYRSWLLPSADPKLSFDFAQYIRGKIDIIEMLLLKFYSGDEDDESRDNDSK